MMMMMGIIMPMVPFSGGSLRETWSYDDNDYYNIMVIIKTMMMMITIMMMTMVIMALTLQVLFSGVSLEETWAAMEMLVHLGLVKAIGLSNFNSKQILRILEVAKVRPAVLQVESNPRFANEALRQFCSRHSIKMVAFSPFGSPDLPWGEKLPHILAEPRLVELAQRLNRSPAQVVLRWQIQRGVGVIPKSVFPKELSDNLGVWGWTLGPEDMQVLNAMETGVRKIVPLIVMPNGEQRVRDVDDINFPFGFTEAADCD